MVVVMSFNDRHDTFHGQGRVIVSTVTVFVWVYLFSFARGFPKTGHLIRALVAILWDARVFCALMLLIWIAFTQAFQVYYNVPLNQSGLGEVLMYVYVIGIIGDGAD